MAEKKDLQQTKGAFKLIGKVNRIGRDNTYKEDTMTKGKYEGETYRSLRFGVKTSETNENFVEMFDFEPKEVFLWNSEKRKKEGKSYKGDKVPFEQWIEEQDELREQGYAVLQTRVGIHYGEDGKIETQGLPSFVASEKIYNGFDDDDTVVIEGSIRYSSYKDQEGKTKKRKHLTIEKMIRLDEDKVDFEAEDFEEVTYFEQEFVYVDAEKDQRSNKVFVVGRVIAYGGKWEDAEFVVDYNDGDGGIDEDMKELADHFLKKVKFGDLVSVFGDVLNRAIPKEVEEEKPEKTKDLLGGGRKKPKHAEKYTAYDYISEMQIHGGEILEKKAYKDEDFVKDELVEEEKPKTTKKENSLGGKKKESPFKKKTVEDEPIDIDDDDLPF